MVVIYNHRGTGCGAGPVEYLLGKKGEREEARLLRGNPEQTRDLIDSLSFSKKYTSGTLSLNELNLDENVKKNLMDEFEKTTFCGLEHDQYDILWVEHRDKNNLELNFVIPNVELRTGKRFQPYYDKIDRTRINAYRDIMNFKHGLTFPEAVERRQITSLRKDLPREKAEAVKTINEAVEREIRAGNIKDRPSVIKFLTTNGLKIARLTPSAISIENPEGGQNIRLKGAVYGESFRLDELIKEQQRAVEAGVGSRNSAEFDRLQAELEQRIVKRAGYNQGRFNKIRGRGAEPVVLDVGRTEKSDGRNQGKSEGLGRQSGKEFDADHRRDSLGGIGDPRVFQSRDTVSSQQTGDLNETGRSSNQTKRDAQELRHRGENGHQRDLATVAEGVGDLSPMDVRRQEQSLYKAQLGRENDTSRNHAQRIFEGVAGQIRETGRRISASFGRIADAVKGYGETISRGLRGQWQDKEESTRFERQIGRLDKCLEEIKKQTRNRDRGGFSR